MADATQVNVVVDVPVTMANFDVGGLCDRVVQLAEELLRSRGSTMLPETPKHTLELVKAHMARWRRYIAAVAVPDDPMWRPLSEDHETPVLRFPADERVNQVENRDVKAILWRCRAIYVEMGASQSKDRSTGLLPEDLARFNALMENMDSFVAFIVAEPTYEAPETVEGVPQDLTTTTVTTR